VRGPWALYGSLGDVPKQCGRGGAGANNRSGKEKGAPPKGLGQGTDTIEGEDEGMAMVLLTSHTSLVDRSDARGHRVL